MAVFPFMQKIDGKRFLVIGSGDVACRKVRLLLQFTEQITVIAHTGPGDVDAETLSLKKAGNASVKAVKQRKAKDVIAEAAGPVNVEYSRIEKAGDCCGILREAPEFSEKGVEIFYRYFAVEDLLKADYCIASSDDKKENRRISEMCRAAGIPVNVPDDPALCTFFMPAVIKRGSLVITISTGGSSPAMSAGLRRRVEDLLPEKTEDILDCMAELRTWIPDVLPHSRERGRLYADILADLMDGALEPTEEAVRSAAEAWILKSRSMDSNIVAEKTYENVDDL